MTKKTSSLVESINILSELVVEEKLNFDNFLKKLIKIIENIIPADSVLIYIYQEDKGHAQLVASNTSKQKRTIDKVYLKKGEGITGWVVENRKSVIISDNAYKDERFKVFEELPEDKYESFMSVPILFKDKVVGIINIQNKNKYDFTEEEILLIESIVKIVASALRSVLLISRVESLGKKLEDRKIIEKAKGLLMKEQKISESKAYRMMQTEAMKKRKNLKQIAEAIIIVFG